MTTSVIGLGFVQLYKKVKKIALHPKFLIVVIWGSAIGCLIMLIEYIIDYIQWESNHTIFMISLAPFIGFLIVGLFSFFYLRSMLLGAICGVAYEIPFFIRALFLIPSPIYLLALIILFPIYALPGIIAGVIGGYLSKKFHRD